MGLRLNLKTPLVTKLLAVSGAKGFMVVFARRKLTIAAIVTTKPTPSKTEDISCCAGITNCHELVKRATSHINKTQTNKTIGGGILLFIAKRQKKRRPCVLFYRNLDKLIDVKKSSIAL